MKGQSNSGFIKLHRNILNWEWYDDPMVFKVFLHILLTANYQDTQWHGVTIKRGQRVYSRAGLARELCISEQTVRTSLKKLFSTNELTNWTCPKYSLVTVSNYDSYQSPTNSSTSCQPAPNQQATSFQPQIKNNKNIKNKKNIRSEGEASPQSPSPPNAYGRYKNVLLSHEEMEQLQGEFPDWEQRVERLSEYMAQSGRTYQSHLATIRAWARQDREEKAQKAEAEKSKERSQSYDIEEFEQWLEYGAPPTLD